MMIFFMLSGALRSAGDARTPLILGVVMTVLNLVLNIILIRGLGPIPRFGTAGRGDGNMYRFGQRRRVRNGQAVARWLGSVVSARGSSVLIGKSFAHSFDLAYRPESRESR